MSENYYKIECISEKAENLSLLFGELKKLDRRDERTDIDGPLQVFFSGWDDPSVSFVSLYGNLLLFTVVTSNHDILSKHQIMALHSMGADFIRVHAEYGQVGDSRGYCYHAGNKIPAKSFPEPVLDDLGKAYMFLMECKDGPLSVLINEGLSPDVEIEGLPLFIHVCRGSLNKSLAAFVKVGVDLDAYKNYPRELVSGISCIKNRKDRHKLLKGVIASGADVNEIWIRSSGFFTDPDMTAMLIAAGSDINQRLADWRGSLFFHSGELFDDEPTLVALLGLNGAQAIPPEPYRPAVRLKHLIYGWRGACSIEQLVADGIDLNVSVEGEPAVLCALYRNPIVALGLISAGADISKWLESKYFQEKVLSKIVSSYSDIPSGEEDLLAVLGIIRLLLERGLDLNMECRFYVYYKCSSCFGYVGSLFMLLMNFCCAQGNRLAPFRLSLARLFIERGADINVPSGNEKYPHIDDLSLLRLELADDYVERFRHLGGVSSLYHLQQQGSPDPADKQFIKFLMDNGGISIRTEQSV